jgi:hypothetical protein
MKLMFSCLGFSSCEVFLVDSKGSQFHIGFIFDRGLGPKEFSFFGIYLDRFREHLPTAIQVVEEYERQYAEKGVSINGKIQFAG